MSYRDSELIHTGRRLLNVGVVIYVVGNRQPLCPVETPGEWCPLSPDKVTQPRSPMERGTWLQVTGSSAGTKTR